MAQRFNEPYNTPAGGREWDMGKGWENPDSSAAPRGTVRRREDDEWSGQAGFAEGNEGEWKRRKTNSQDAQGYDESAAYGTLQGQQDWGPAQGHGEGEGYQQGYRGGAPAGGGGFGRGGGVPGGGPRGRTGGPSEPSQHVIFLGLDPDYAENDLRDFLVGQGLGVDSATIIRDRVTGMSRSFGFAQFSSVAEATRFLQPNYPFVELPPPASHAFGGVVNDTPGRRVKIDFSQSAHPPRWGGQGPGQPMVNDGSRDMGSSQTAVLLLRGLDPLTSVDDVERALRAAAGEGKEGAKGMKRIDLIRDRLTRMGWGFAFVEFTSVANAAALLGYTMTPQLHPNGFRVLDKPVATCFAHPYSFQPLPPGTPKDEYCISSSINMGGQEGWWTKYWDEAAGIAEKKFEVEEEEPVKKEPMKEKKKKGKAKETEDDVPDIAPGPSLLQSAGPISLKLSSKSAALGDKRSIAINIPKTGDANATATVKVPVLGFGADDVGDGYEPEDDDSTMIKVNKGTKVAPLVASKKIASNINKWNAKQEQTHTEVAPPQAATPALAPTKRAVPQAPSTKTSPPADQFEYGDTFTMACLLCSRKFNSLEQLRRHDQESDLHKKNLRDDALREVAKQKKADAARARQTEEQKKYRDRASERREIYGQPEVPPPEAPSNKKRKSSPSPPPVPAPPVNPGKDENNVGNKLLKKMGWAEGTGLGTEGEGRVDPIETALFAQGAGLGASKGQAIGKYPDGIRGYVAKAKDSARDRYNQ